MKNGTQAERLLRQDLCSRIDVQGRDAHWVCDSETACDHMKRTGEESVNSAMEAFHRGDVEEFLSVLDNTERLRFVFDHRQALSNRGILEAALVSAWNQTRVNNCLFDPMTLEFIFLWLCDRDELWSAGDPLPHSGPFVVYRGVSGRGLLRRVRGLAWTASLDVACWFAMRLGDLADPAVYKARIQADDVFFYANGRCEQEFVCRPERCARLLLSNGEMKSRSAVRQAQVTMNRFGRSPEHPMGLGAG